MHTTKPLTLIVALVAVALLCAGCARPAPDAPEAARPPAEAPGRAPAAWIVADPAALAAAALASAETTPAPASPRPAAPAGWARPADRWMAAELRRIAADSLSAPRAARALALLAVGLHDGLLAAEAARAAGAAVSDDALMAEVAAALAAHSHPARADEARAVAEEARLAGGDPWAALVAGRRIGAAVAREVIAWDRADAEAALGLPDQRPAAEMPGSWRPTPPSFGAPELPGWGGARTLALTQTAGFRAPPPPAWDSPAMDAERRAFAEAQRGMGEPERALAGRWAGGPGSVSPPGLWVELAAAQISGAGLSLRETVAVYAELSVAMHDASIVCWETKYAYGVIRPVSWMAEAQPGWRPLLSTPPHPSYPSGHAAISGAASAILAAHFPAAAEGLAGEAAAAASSRVLGGVHWPMDGAAGLAQGRAVAAAVLATIREGASR